MMVRRLNLGKKDIQIPASLLVAHLYLLQCPETRVPSLRVYPFTHVEPLDEYDLLLDREGCFVPILPVWGFKFPSDDQLFQKLSSRFVL